tara:strand:+ start:3038 stop:4042 length:1005 start_codon:yes stop_codon:yes gene_type:complete
MTVSASTHPTLLDVAQAQNADGTLADVVEILDQQNEMLPDMVWMESNEPLSHRHDVRTGLPGATWRRMYEGVQPSKATMATVIDTIGNLEEYAEVDVDAANLNGNSAAWRMRQETPHIESMNQEVQSTMIYGNETTAPSEFTGFAPRFNDLSADNADNIIAGGGAGVDNASIWLVVWGPDTAFGLYPKGSMAGLQVNDKGQVTIEDTTGSNGGRMEAYRTHYKWQCGLAVVDWRYVVRICNIDKSLLNKDPSVSGADLPDLMFQAIEYIPNLSKGRAAFYMSRDVRSMVRRQHAKSISNATLTVENVGGVSIERFHGIPMRRVDALAADEALVS